MQAGLGHMRARSASPASAPFSWASSRPLLEQLPLVRRPLSPLQLLELPSSKSLF